MDQTPERIEEDQEKTKEEKEQGLGEYQTADIQALHQPHQSDEGFEDKGAKQKNQAEAEQVKGQDGQAEFNVVD